MTSTTVIDLLTLSLSLARSTQYDHSIPYRLWKETKQQPCRTRPGHQLSCCLVLLIFLWETLWPDSVQYSVCQKIEVCISWHLCVSWTMPSSPLQMSYIEAPIYALCCYRSASLLRLWPLVHGRMMGLFACCSHLQSRLHFVMHSKRRHKGVRWRGRTRTGVPKPLPFHKIQLSISEHLVWVQHYACTKD